MARAQAFPGQPEPKLDLQHGLVRAPGTEVPLSALEKAKADRQAHGGIESERPGHLGSRGTCHVGTMKGVGRICRQTFVDTCSRVTICKLYTGKTAITSADLARRPRHPFFAEHGIALLRILIDRGTECCGKVENHACQLYLAVEDIDHTRTKTRRPQTTRRPTASASASTAPSGTHSMAAPSARRSAHGIAFRKKIGRPEDRPPGRGTADGSRCVAGEIRRAAAAFGKIPLRQDPCADLPGNATHRRGQDDQGFRDIGQPATLSQHCPPRSASDRV